MPRSFRSCALAALAYGLLAVVWARPTSLAPWDTVPDGGDPLHLAWVMAWDAHALVRQPLSLFEANTFHPYRQSLAFADHLLPEAVVVAPVQWVTGNAILASNVALLLALTLSALSMFALVHALTGSGAASFLAGLAYGFNSFTLHELPRVHVLNLQWWPLAMFFLLRFTRNGHVRDAGLFATTLALQGLSGTYYLVYSALLLPGWLLAAYLGARRLPDRREAVALVTAMAAVAVPVALFLEPYRQLFETLGLEKSWAGGADLLAYLDPPPRNWLWSSVNLGTRSELPHFLGYATATFVVVGIAVVVAGRRQPGSSAPSSRGLGLMALLTLVLGITLSLGPLVHVGGVLWGGGPYDILYWHLPFAKAMASPERIGVLAVLGASTLLGIGAASLLARLSSGARPVVACGLAILLPLEHWAPPRAGARVPAGSGVPAAYRWLAHEPREPTVELPLYPDRSKKLWAAYLYLSTYHWRPIPIGRTSFYPPAHDFLAWCLRGFPDDTSLAALDRVGIRTVVVHPWAWDPAEREGKLAAVNAERSMRLRLRFDGRPAERYADLALGDERVYDLVPPPRPAQPCAPAGEISREGWALRSTGVNKEDRLRDGDPRTAWMTARPQTPGDYLEVALEHPETLTAASLGLTYPFDEFPRILVLSGRGEGEEGWHRVAFADGPAERVASLDELLERPKGAALVLRFAGERLERLRFALGAREADPAWPRWAVSELRLYRECR